MNVKEYADMILQPEVITKKVTCEDKGCTYQITLLMKDGHGVGMFAKELHPVERTGCYGEPCLANEVSMSHEKMSELFMREIRREAK